MSKVLVTGAAGFIGKEIAAYFLQNGYEVAGWDRIAAEGAFPVVLVDMTDEAAVRDALAEAKPDIIIHCAGSADVGKSVENPYTDYTGNVTITHNLLFGMCQAGLEKMRMLFLSSASVYGNPQKLPITEETPLNPLSPYAVHKVMCEVLCHYFSAHYGMDIRIARIFSAYGAGLRKQIFWDMYRKLETTGRLDMFGTGNESRDYIHVKDLIRALFILATTDESEPVCNVANGVEVTIREATELFAECAGAAPEQIRFNGVVREGDPLNWRADISKIEKLGYRPAVSIKDGIRQYVEWVKGQM